MLSISWLNSSSFRIGSFGMNGDAARAHGVEFGLHGGVGRGRYDGEFLAESQGVSGHEGFSAGVVRMIGF
jgi:hypothetical protein